MSELQDNEREIVERTVLLIGGMALVSGLLAAALGVRLVGRPLRALMEKTRLIAAGNLQGPIHLGTRDELAKLGESLNLMCQQLAQSQGKIREETAIRIAAMEQLRHADRLKTVGRMASGIAHELGTPLSVVAGRAGLIGSGKLTTEEIAASAAAIKAEADKMTKIIRQLLDFARANTPHKTAVDLRQVAGQTVDLLRPLAEKRNVELRLAAGGDPAVAEIDAGQIQQVLTNLIVNAVEAMPGGGKADITVRSQAACPPEGGDARPSSVLRRRGPRRGRGNRRGTPLAPVRALLHHQGGRRRDRPGAVHRLRDRPGARRLDRRDQPAGTREAGLSSSCPREPSRETENPHCRRRAEHVRFVGNGPAVARLCALLLHLRRGGFGGLRPRGL